MSFVDKVGRGQDRCSGYVIDLGEAVSLGLVASLTNWRRNLRSTVLVLVRLELEMDPEGRVFQSFCCRHVRVLQIGVFSDKCNSNGVKQRLLPKVCI